MCGIAGILNLSGNSRISIRNLRNMGYMLRHRGPDGYGYYTDEQIGLVHARLSIIDLEGGWQPIYNEDRTLCIIFNGEIFNYIELRKLLEDKGHRFSTKSDTEVIIHLYEDYGQDCLAYLNGQFAFAIWNAQSRKLFIARDRVGIRPLFYTIADGVMFFASEIKSLFVDRRVRREIDPYALDQIFTFWMTIPPRTAFKDVLELPAGHHMTVEHGNISVQKYWDPDFTPESRSRSEAEYAEMLRELLIDATRLQLRADVPVGAYLSGGIDSAVITALIKNYTDAPLRTFSVTFSDTTYDESEYQKLMIQHLNTEHSNINCDYDDIGSIFPEVIWHTEKPVIRTAPAPLYLLSKLVRDSGYKVVLTGEGSDEILAGYDIFKEVKVRSFIEKYPDSKFRPLILKRLYPYLEHSPVKSLKYAETFFRTGQSAYPSEYRSHLTRWNTTSMIKAFFSDSLKERIRDYTNADELSGYLSGDIVRYDGVSRAQYIEMKTLLSGYLLSSQGDRVTSAHSVEGRFPFLDHRVIEFACKLPSAVRMKTLTEKYVLKESMRDVLPDRVIKRNKQPYMAPDAKSLLNRETNYIEELISEDYLKESAYFNPQSVSALLKKSRKSPVLGFKDNMAVVGIISTLLLHNQFIKHYDSQITYGKERERLSGECELAV